jgi:hypothetical protein
MRWVDELAISATSERKNRLWVSCTGSGQRWSPERSPAARTLASHSSSRPITAAW